MQYDVIITKKPDAPWHATIPARPGYVAEGPTREDALAWLAAQFDAGSYTEVTRIEIPDTAAGNGDEPPPSGIMKYFGAFRDDPTWGEMFDEIGRQRDDTRIEDNEDEPPSGLTKYFGAFRDDPYLDELFDDIERRRDEHLV